MSKPELLLPAGHPEAFYAACRGGAGAVYLGLKSFNARARAFNFTPAQLLALIGEARHRGIKVFITLNTLIKNQELSALVEVLHFLSQAGPDAVIIQDWGIYLLIRKHFPGLTIHSSTQMGVHNSAGARYAGRKGIRRVILAREMTLAEIKTVTAARAVETEVFIHGALCYSVSGMCLFSSWLGGHSANRGMCKQPCRRQYDNGKEKHFFFNLKDQEQAERIPELVKTNVDCFKVEGRLKSAEYVYHVAKAYRMILDHPEKISEAKEWLNKDMGREKTGYFLQGNVKQSITSEPYGGELLGTIQSKTQNSITLSTKATITPGNRLRIRPEKKNEQGMPFKVSEVSHDTHRDTHNQITLSGKIPEEASPGDRVYRTEHRQEKFQDKLNTKDIKLPPKISPKKIKTILHCPEPPPGKKTETYVRADSLQWLRKIHLPSVSAVILNLTRNQWEELPLNSPFLRKNAQKIIVELPGFIPEKALSFYENLAKDLYSRGFQQFSLSHLWQNTLLPDNSKPITNENVYAANDMAVMHLQQEGMEGFIYPLENDWENLRSMKHKNGIIPVYFTPALFTSRMPVDPEKFTSDQKEKFQRTTREGITYIHPEAPVCLFPHTGKMKKAGFNRFLLDLSGQKPSGNKLNTLIKRFHSETQVQPSTTFNFSRGLS